MSTWVDIRNTLESVIGDAAPIVLGALGGPAGSAVGNVIAHALGVTGANGVNTALASDPSALAKIKELEITRGLDIAQLDAQARTAQIGIVAREVKYGGLLGQWEDVLGWVCALIFGYAFLVIPTAQAIASLAGLALLNWPHYDLSSVLTVLATLIGAGGIKIVRSKYGHAS